MSKVKITFLDDWEYWFTHHINQQSFQDKADIQIMSEHITGDALLKCLEETEVLVLFRERTAITADILKHCTALRHIICTGAQTRNLDIDAATALGIQVSYAKGGNSKDSTCELTWALILAAFKKLSQLTMTAVDRRWRKETSSVVYVPPLLKGKRLGIIGLGHIGQKVAKIAQAFGMGVVCWSPNMTPERADESGVVMLSKEELLETSDVISLHLVLSESTQSILNQQDLAHLKETVCLVNTARAELIHQDDLITFLRHHPQATYATDVFDHEPLSEVHPFFELNNVVMTGHWGFVCDDVLNSFTQEVEKQLKAYCL